PDSRRERFRRHSRAASGRRSGLVQRALILKFAPRRKEAVLPVHSDKYVCTVYSVPGTEYAHVNSTPTAILISTSSASGSINPAGETPAPPYPCTTGFSSVPMPSILISTMSLGWSVKLLSGRMPGPGGG